MTTRKSTKKESNYYSLSNILKETADFNIIIGERGNGKTYAIQEYCIKEFLKNGGQMLLLRRWMEDIKPSNAINFFDGNIISNLPEWSNGEYTNIEFRNYSYYLCSYDEKGKPILSEKNIFAYVRDVSESERIKGQSFPYVSNIVYEEFISLAQNGYLPDETGYFLNILSTVTRDRTNVKIWMLGNTVNPYNPYFDLFGIKGLELEKGTIWTRIDTTTGRKTAVEWCQQRRKGSLLGTSAKYTYFDTGKNGVSDMIITGDWQLPNYPCQKFQAKYSIFEISLSFDGKFFILHIMQNGSKSWIFVRKVEHLTNKCVYFLDLNPSQKPHFYTAFENLPVNDATILLNSLVNNQKIWFDEPMTGCYFYNFVGQSRRNLTN